MVPYGDLVMLDCVYHWLFHISQVRMNCNAVADGRGSMAVIVGAICLYLQLCGGHGPHGSYTYGLYQWRI